MTREDISGDSARKDILQRKSEHPAPAPGPVHYKLTCVLQGLMVLSIPVAIYEQQWMTVFLVSCILGLTLLPSLIVRRFAVWVPAELELLAVLFIFSSLFLFNIHGYYDRFWWWDVVMHTSSGFLLGIAGFLLVYVLNRRQDVEIYMTPAFVALFSFAFALAVGAVWEIFEFGMDSIFGMNLQRTGLQDTMWDLIVDGFGALIISLMGYVYTRKGTEYFVERWINRFIEKNPEMFNRT